MRTICTVAGVAAFFLLTATLFAATQASAAGSAEAASDPVSAPISDADLDGMRGGEATLPAGLSMVLTDQSQTATNGYNTVSAGGNVTSGDVNLGQGALQGFAGIGNFVINTGANANVLGSLSVAINLAPTGVP